MNQTFDVAIVGAGVFGAWTAWHLQRAGQRVVLIDQYGPGNARASSGGETRVIRMAYGADEIYTRMASRSLSAWTELFANIGQPDLFRKTGVLWLADEDALRAQQSLAVLAGNDIRHERIEHAALLRRYPQIVVAPGGWALFEPDSGVLLARRSVQAVVQDVLRGGGELRIGSVLPPAGEGRLSEVRIGTGETIRADRFVFACGPWLAAMLPGALGGRIFPTRQEIFYFGVAAGDLRFRAPALPTWLDFGGEYYGMPDINGRGFKIAHDAHGERCDPDTIERVPSAVRIAHARQFLAKRFPALAAAPVLGAEVCQYENTWNGDFVIDRASRFDNVWIVGGGSGHGFKHGPEVGAYLRARMFDGAAPEPRFALAHLRTRQQREVH